MRRAKLVLLWLTAILLAGYAVLVVALYLFQRSMLYVPDRSRPAAAALGLPALREVELVTEDGLRLLAWYLPPAQGDGFVAAYFHGNGGNIAYRIGHLRRFATAGWGALLLEYRGYGGNPGKPSETGLYADARAALAFLGQQHLAAGRTVLYGESLGTGVAVRMASEQPVAALLLESPYTSIASVAKRHYPLVPIDFLLKDRFDALPRIAAVRAPLLVMQAGRDEVVPTREGRALYEAAPGPKEIWIAPEANHNNLFAYGVTDVAIDFVQRHAPLP